MEVDGDEIPSSPTDSSPSSSDLDTESTGSFFPDRSTTLGTLMGVTLNPASSHSFRPQPPRISTAPQPPTPAIRQRRRHRRRRGRSGWWKLCRDDSAGSTKLGEFLEVERRINNEAVLIEAEFGYGGEAMPREEGRLFENGRVLPSVNSGIVAARRRKGAEVTSLVRFPVLLTGICSGGEE